MAEADDLPKTIVRRVVKDKLSRCSEDGDINVHKDALLAFSESARIFIHYISATANDICKESRRQIINAEDVFKALEETEFTEFVRPLKASLEEFRKKNAGKKAAASKDKESKTNKKRKLEGEPSDKAEASDRGKAGEASDKGEASEVSDKAEASEASDKGEASEASHKSEAGEASDKGETSEASDQGEAGDSERDESDEGCSSHD